MRMEKCTIFFCIKPLKLVFIGFNEQYPSIHLSLLESMSIIHYCDLKKFGCCQLCSCLYTRIYLSYNRSKFTWMVRLEDIAKIILLEDIFKFEGSQIICF
jgi:hypothetical protein